MRLHLVAAVTCGLLLLSSGAQAAEVKVLASGAVKEAALELIPQFEKTSGHTVTVTWAGTVDIKKKVAAGETSPSLPRRELHHAIGAVDQLIRFLRRHRGSHRCELSWTSAWVV